MKDLFPQIVASVSRYEFRNNDDYVIQRRRTQRFANSFIPSSTELWNQLPVYIREENTLSSFKSSLLRNSFVAPTFPKYFVYGNKKISVIHARIRNKCSDLNHDLFLNRLRDNEICDGGFEKEDAEHYFFNCRKYLNERRKLFRNTHKFHPLNLDTILRGRDSLTLEDNVNIFNSVHEYIRTQSVFEYM